MPPKPKSLSDLEREIIAEYGQISSSSIAQIETPKRKSPSWLSWRTKLTFLCGFILLAGGIVGLANLPMSRYVIASQAPILLLPSYLQFERDYHQAIGSFGELSQLVNRATSIADINLSSQKIKDIQSKFAALPVEFLTAYPEWGFGWYRWRFDRYQFRQINQELGRIEARIFQEKNADRLLTTTAVEIDRHRQQYQQAQNEIDREQARIALQQAIDQLKLIPEETIAGKEANLKLATLDRDLRDGSKTRSTNITLNTAQEFARQGQELTARSPQPADRWETIEQMWIKAIDIIEKIPPEDLNNYAAAQALLPKYTVALGEARHRQKLEIDAAQTLDRVKQRIDRLTSHAEPLEANYLRHELQQIVQQLTEVPSGTTSYARSQELLKSARNKLTQIPKTTKP